MGFRVQTILMDYEFDNVQDHVSTINMNTPTASEHIAEIEWQIWAIKECVRSILCTLPYKCLTPLMLIWLLHFVIIWLNNFPLATGISTQFSPRELILHHCLDYSKHCKVPFGPYCKTHEEYDPTNSMDTQGTPYIYLGPTGNLQGSYYFLSLVTVKLITRWLPVPQAFIDCIAHFTKNSLWI